MKAASLLGSLAVSGGAVTFGYFATSIPQRESTGHKRSKIPPKWEPQSSHTENDTLPEWIKYLTNKLIWLCEENKCPDMGDSVSTKKEWHKSWFSGAIVQWGLSEQDIQIVEWDFDINEDPRNSTGDSRYNNQDMFSNHKTPPKPTELKNKISTILGTEFISEAYDLGYSSSYFLTPGKVEGGESSQSYQDPSNDEEFPRVGWDFYWEKREPVQGDENHHES